MGFLRRMFRGREEYDVLGDPSLSRAMKLTSEGNYHGKRGDLDRAIACFQKAISNKPGYVLAHLSLAIAYREKGEYQRALDVLSTAPSTSDAGEFMDLAFEIAFHRASVLIARYKGTGFRGPMPDLIAALEQAREIGRRPVTVTESQENAARAFRMDLQAERGEKMAMIEGLLTEIRSEH